MSGDTTGLVHARGGWTESAGAETPEPVVSGNEQLHSLTLEYRL